MNFLESIKQNPLQGDEITKNIRNKRYFFEFWAQYLIWQPSAAKLQSSPYEGLIDNDCSSLQKCSPMASKINSERFLGVNFSHHMEILPQFGTRMS